LTPVASTTALITRPPSRTFIVSASATTNVDGPAWSSRLWQDEHSGMYEFRSVLYG
jgi:hypothetical protein